MPTLQEMIEKHKLNGAAGNIFFNNIEGHVLYNIYVIIMTIIY